MTTDGGTHERYLHSVRAAILAHANITPEHEHRLTHAKLLYGVGDGTTRGLCHYGAWQNGVGRVDVVELLASGQESFVQLAGTVLHELAHVLANGDGHGNTWKDTCVSLGFRIRPAAAGQVYHLAMFAPALRHAIWALVSEIRDGSPAFRGNGRSTFAPMGGFTLAVSALRPCSAGVGTKGGTSRGKGSGSRLRLWECEGCPKPVKVRVSSDYFRAHCDECGTAFKQPQPKTS